MIKNERQYRITKAQAEKFDRALREMESADPEPDVHPIFHKGQLDALRGQLQELRQELLEYEALRSGERKAFTLESFDGLGRALIQARIASGMTQEGLAGQLGLKPQQIQRYEATDYRSASLDRIREIINALGMKLQKGVDLPTGKSSVNVLFKRLKEVGLDKDFVVRRLLPLTVDTRTERADSVAFEATEAVRRVFGWDPAVLFSSEPLSLAAAAAAAARFKLPARVNEERLSAYVVYAHYLALLVLEATAHIEPRNIPLEASEFRRDVLEQFGEITFENVIRFIWSLGVPILPLNDPGAFHGACWRAQGRNVIVLKQRTPSPARWLHDVLHEVWHAAHEPDLEQHPVVEESELSPSRRQSQEELAASQFAGDVVLNGRAEELTGECVSQARGQVPFLKSVVPKVARKAGVPVGALANYMAYRLTLQGINWWGTAANLQDRVEEFQATPRELLLRNIDLNRLNDIDRGLLLRALEPIVLGLSGASGAGKTAVAEAISNTLRWRTASFGEYVRTVARRQGLDDSSRDVLEDLGEQLVKEDVDRFCLAVLTHFNWKSGEPLVIEGVRHEQVAEALRRLVAPMDFRIVYLEVDDQTRKERLRQRGTREEEVERMGEHPTERVVKEEIPQIADLTLRGTRPLDEVVSDIVTWVHEGDGGRRAA